MLAIPAIQDEMDQIGCRGGAAVAAGAGIIDAARASLEEDGHDSRHCEV